MDVKPFVFEPTPIPKSSNSGLKITAKKYTVGNSSENEQGLTLILTHCIGSHKEQWEPTIEKMFAVQRHKNLRSQIREAWSFDWQSHGDAGLVNREMLKDRKEGVSVYEWAAALTSFVRSYRMRGHRIVAIGHSGGAGAITLTTKDFPLSRIPYTTIILVESAIVTREVFHADYDDRMLQRNYVVSATSERTDRWPSREVALKWFMKRYPWNTWNPDIVRLFVEYALYEEPDGTVRLKCDKRLEAMAYTDVEGHFESAEILSYICHAVPVHLVWGAVDDIIPEQIKNSLSDASQGRAVASVKKVEDAGHMVVQEQPIRLAETLCDIIDKIEIENHICSKL